MARSPDGTAEGWTAALLTGQSGTAAVDEHCHELVESGDVANAHVLLVTYTTSPDRRLERWDRHVDARPRHLEILGVGDSPRSAAATSRGTVASPRGDVTVSYASPTDLTGVGIRISERLAEWARDASHGSSPFLLCFDSLTALLAYAELERAFRFVHVLTGRLRTAGARGHFHLDPAAHDDQTVATLAPLFDAVLDGTDE